MAYRGARRGSARRGPATRGPARRGSARRGPARRGPARRGARQAINSCPPGMHMQNGTCVSPVSYSNVGSGYASRRGRINRVASKRRGARQMGAGGTHYSSAGVAYNCPPGQSGIQANCVPINSSPYGHKTY
jgi:hypothetical protein